MNVLFSSLLFFSIQIWFSIPVFAQTGNKIVEIDSTAKTITVIKSKSRGTGQGWGGFSPKYTKEIKKVYGFDYKIQSKSISSTKHSGCIGTPIKSKVIEYENGKRVSKSVKNGNQNRQVKGKKSLDELIQKP